MKILIDDASIENIKEIYNEYPMEGVTTNPSILAKAGKNPYEALKEIRAFIGNKAELHVQVISSTTEGMVAEGRKIASELGVNTYIKIPAIPAGLKAMRILSSEGFHVTATAIYMPMQGFLAAKAGADYVAPYLNRIDNQGYDGVEVATRIQDIFNRTGLKTKILAASFKNTLQVQELCVYGVGAVTMTPDVIRNLIKNASVTDALEVFTHDFEALCGEGKTMLDC